MKDWFSKNMGDAMLAYAPLSRIEETFVAEHVKRDKPIEMAVFTRHESEGGLHCEVIAYFSPASSVVARAVGAQPCKRPLPNGLGLLAGSDDCWQKLFPERGAYSRTAS